MSTLQQGYIWVSGLGDICFSKWIAELWGTTGDEEGDRGPAPANKLIEQKWSSIPIKHLELNSNPTHRVDLKTLKTITFFLFLRDLHGLKGSTGRRRATECRRMMNSQTGIKFHDWDSWAVWQRTNGQLHRHRGRRPANGCARPLPHRFTAQKLNHSWM